MANVIGLHGFRCYLHVIEFDTNVLCHVFTHCIGSFLLQDMLLSLHEFAFEGQNMNFTVNMLLTCILYCAPGPALIRTVRKYSMLFLITDIIFVLVFLRRRRSFTSRKLYVCLQTFLDFLSLDLVITSVSNLLKHASDKHFVEGF